MTKSLIQLWGTTGFREALIWLLALVFLAMYSPEESQHFTVCPLALAGFESCPGCGLGRSVSYLLHGNLQASIQMHWLGIPATLLLAWRIISVIHNIIKNQTSPS